MRKGRNQKSIYQGLLSASLLGLCMFPVIANAGDTDNPFATPEERVAAAAPRTWSDASGKFKIEARLLRIEDGKVVLRRTDDKEVTVPLDKLCEADQKYAASIGGAKSSAQAGSKSADKASDAGSDSQTGGTKISVTETDFSKAKVVDLGGSVEWTYKPDPAPAGEKLPSARVTLAPLEFFDHLQKILLLPAEKKAFVVSFDHDPSRKAHSSRVQMCNLESGKMEASALFAQEESPIDIAPDGTLVLGQMEQFGQGNKTELHLYSREGNKVKPLAAWRPFHSPSANEHEHDEEVRWAAFADSKHVLTVSTFGRLVLWEVPSLRPIWATKVAFATDPVLSAGRKYLFMATSEISAAGAASGRPIGGLLAPARPHGAIAVLNVADGTEVGQIDLEDGDLNISGLALREDGQRLAVGQSGRIRVWDLASREMTRDFAMLQDLHPIDGRDLKWTSDNHLLINGNLLVDVDRRAPIWMYDNMHQISVVRDGKVWFLEGGVGGGGVKVLTSAAVPNKAVLDSVASLKPDDLLVLHPGMEISLDVQLNGDGDEIAAAKKGLQERLQKNGMKVASDLGSKNRLTVTVQPGKTQTVRYHSFGHPFGEAQEHQVATEMLSLTLELNGETVWKYESGTSPPGLLHLKEGETIDGALARIMKEQGDSLPKRCASVWIPAYIARVPGSANADKGGQQGSPRGRKIGNHET
jgi:WD40 repeat protein